MPSAVKEKFVKELTEELKSSPHVLVTDYQGLKAEQFNELRTKLRQAGAKFKVVKNRLARIATKNVGWKIEEHLKGPSAITFSGEDSAAITKVLYDFGKKNKTLKVKGGFLFGEVADDKTIKAIADLPSKEVLLATLAARLNGPLVKLVATLNEPIRSLHAALSAVAKKKESNPAS